MKRARVTPDGEVAVAIQRASSSEAEAAADDDINMAKEDASGLSAQVFGQFVRYINDSSGGNRSSMTPTKAREIAEEVNSGSGLG